MGVLVAIGWFFASLGAAYGGSGSDDANPGAVVGEWPYGLPPVTVPDCLVRTGWAPSVVRSGPSGKVYTYTRLIRWWAEASLVDGGSLDALLGGASNSILLSELRPVHAEVIEGADGQCRVGRVWRSERTATLEELVAALGRTSGAFDVDLRLRLARQPRAAVAALVGVLVVEPEPGADWHLFEVLRTLEALTGTSFEYPIPGPLTEDQLRCYGEGQISGYYKYRMSWGMLCTAPKRVREQVVGAWRSWLAKHGATFEPVPAEDFDLGTIR